MRKKSSPSHIFGEMRHSPGADQRFVPQWQVPVQDQDSQGAYEKHKEELQVELLKVQSWVKETGQRIVIHV